MEITTMGGQPVSRLGLAGNPGMDRACAALARQAGVDYFFFYNDSFTSMIEGVGEVLKENREEVCVATGSEVRQRRALRRYLEQMQKRLDVDVVDLFFAEYVSPADDMDEVMEALEEFHRWKEEGTIRYVGATVHSRELAVELIECGRVEVLMHRYNMAHRGAEEKVLPAALTGDLPVVAFTCTRWGSLLEGHRDWQGPVPNAGDCYRYALHHPAVRLALTAPKSAGQLRENLAVFKDWGLAEEKKNTWEEYGALVYGDGRDSFETEWP